MSFTPAEALALLTAAQRDSRLGHAYLITGAIGSGKRQLAADIFRLINRLPFDPSSDLLSTHPDAHTVEPESKSRRIVIEQIRELERALHMKSGQAEKKLGVIIEADRLQPQASNAFLKTLEEPPANSMLLLLTTAPEMLLDTILSRCLILQLRPPAEVVRSPWELKLLDTLSQYFAQPAPASGREIPQIFGLVRDFQDILNDCKDTIAAENKTELKAEEKHLKGTVEARYLEKLEEQYDAQGAARSQRERTHLIELLTTWWTDVSRQRAGIRTHLDLPHYAAQTEWLAGQEDTLATLDRLDALEALKTHLAQNINEPLALEAAFLKAFA
ncbi:MAG: hypothetical protein ABIT76_07265 [Chthoniobacterales bacterium]